MSDFYKSLKLRMRDTLPWKKDNSMPLARVKSATALTLNREMERVERFVAERIGKLKEAVKAGEAIVLEEARQAEQLVNRLKAEITVLKGELKEAEENIEKKELSSQKIEETLSVKIKTFENDIKKKDETLASRDNEIKECKFKIDQQIKQIGELELAHTKTKEEATKHAKCVQDLAEESQKKITALEAELNEREKLTREKASTIKELEQQLAGKVQEFENMLKGNQELLTRRDSEIAALRSQLKRLTKGIGEMSSFFRQTETLTGIEEQDVSTAAQNEPMYGVEAKPPAVQTHIATPAVSDGLPELVSPEIFQRIIRELAQATNVIDPLASLIVQQQAKALGESMEKFPRSRLPELLEALAKEVSNEKLQIDFRQRLASSAQISLN